MNFCRKLYYSILIITSIFYLASCNKEPAASETGIISVQVIDNDTEKTPVPDVEITITPGNIVRKTDSGGSASFEVDPGDYYVIADVCCAGPGYFHYHEPVTVVADETSEVELSACLRCQ